MFLMLLQNINRQYQCCPDKVWMKNLTILDDVHDKRLVKDPQAEEIGSLECEVKSQDCLTANI